MPKKRKNARRKKRRRERPRLHLQKNKERKRKSRRHKNVEHVGKESWRRLKGKRSLFWPKRKRKKKNWHVSRLKRMPRRQLEKQLLPKQRLKSKIKLII